LTSWIIYFAHKVNGVMLVFYIIVLKYVENQYRL